MKYIPLYILIAILVLSCSKAEEIEPLRPHDPCPDELPINNSIIGTWLWKKCGSVGFTGELHETYCAPGEFRMMIFYPNDTVVSIENGTLISVATYQLGDSVGHRQKIDFTFIKNPQSPVMLFDYPNQEFHILNNQLNIGINYPDLGVGCIYKRCN